MMMQAAPAAPSKALELKEQPAGVSGKLCDISVGKDVWGVSAGKRIYRFDNGNWAQVTGELTKISAADDGTVVGCNAQDQVFNYVNGQWIQLPGLLVDVSTGGAFLIFGVNKEGQVWRWDAPTNNWAGIPGAQKMKDLSIGSDGTVYALDESQQIWKLENNSMWIQIPGLLTCISVLDKDNVFGCNAEGAVFRLNAPVTWQRMLTITQPIKRLSIGQNGLWVTANDDSIFKMDVRAPVLNFGAPNAISGLLVDISVGKSMVVGVNKEQSIFKWNNQWIRIPGELTCISCGEDDTVVGCSAANNVFVLGPDGNTWIKLPGLVRDISCGSRKHIVGVNSENSVFSLDMDNNNTWTQIPCPHVLKDLSVGSDGTLYGVTDQQQVVHYNRSMATWNVLPGALVSISVSDKDNIVGVNAEGTVWRLTPPQMWTQVVGAPGSQARLSVGSAGLWLTGKNEAILSMPVV